MFGYKNWEWLWQALTERLVTFWSRSRGALWRKGDSSGKGISLKRQPT